MDNNVPTQFELHQWDRNEQLQQEATIQNAIDRIPIEESAERQEAIRFAAEQMLRFMQSLEHKQLTEETQLALDEVRSWVEWWREQLWSTVESVVEHFAWSQSYTLQHELYEEIYRQEAAQRAESWRLAAADRITNQTDSLPDRWPLQFIKNAAA